MITEQDLQNAMFNSTRVDLSLKALQLLEKLIDPDTAHALPADLRRDLRLAAATILRVKEVDIDDDTREQIARTVHEIQDRISRGEKFTPSDIRRAAVKQLGLREAPTPEPNQRSGEPDSTPTAEFPDLPGALTTNDPAPARTLRAHAGANTAPPRAPSPRSSRQTSPRPQPLKHARPPPPMMAA